MANLRLVVPFWKKRIARAFVGPSGKHRGTERAVVAAEILLLEKAYVLAQSRLAAAIRRVPAGDKIWWPSFLSLGAADVASLSHATSPILKGLEVVGAVGGAGLIGTALRDLKQAATPDQRLDAVGDLAWGAQGLLYLSSTPGAMVAAVGLGVAGAAAQTAVGLRRITNGIRRGDRSMTTLGALDLGGGILWLGWDLLGWEQPVIVGTYVLLMVGREAYANKGSFQELFDAVKEEARMNLSEAREVLVHTTQFVAEALGPPDLDGADGFAQPAR